MYLHRIDLHGFKSFADRTSIQFDPGVTAIVGPNGCGKSNIIDAVRWVLGEQRARLLRSEKMENVIFNGTGTRRALGMAEVALTIHNTRGVLPTEYSEVTIGRRLYRSGESDYLLNGTTCRLKDILDLFMDTGMGAGAYSVIELKMIEDLLSDNPQDRRRLFEEAAGITKYKLRRAQTLRRLDQTQADLERLRDLTEEIDRNVRSLARQAKRAERHREIADRLQATELQLAAYDHARLKADQQQVTSALESLEEQLAERTAQLQLREAEIEAQRTAVLGHEREVANAQRALNDLLVQIRSAEAEARLAAEQAKAAAAAIERIDREAESDDARLHELRTLVTSLDREATASAGELEQAEAMARDRRAELAAAEREAAAARDLQRQADAALQATTAALRGAERERDARRNRHEILTQEHQQLEERRTSSAADQTALRQQLEAAERLIEEQEHVRRGRVAALSAAEADERRLSGEIEQLRERLAAARRRQDAATAEIDLLQGLIESHEGFPEAVQVLLEDDAWAGSPRTVADVIAAPPDLRRAVDAALGPLGECLVVESEAEAQAGIGRLRTHELGRATFLVLERLPQRGPQVVSPTPPGTMPLAGAVSDDDLGARLARTLLANYFIVDDLRSANGIQSSYPIARFVTRDGEWAGGGMIRAGAAERSASGERIGRREQLEAAQATRNEADAETRDLEARLSELHVERGDLGTDELRGALQIAERELAERRRSADVVRARLEALEQTHRDLELRIEELYQQVGEAVDSPELDHAVASARSGIEKAQEARAAAGQALEQAEAGVRSALEAHSEARLVAAQRRSRHESIQRDLDRARQSITEIEARKGARVGEREQLEASQRSAEARVQENEDRTTHLKDKLGEAQAAVQAAENRLVDARSATSDAEALLRELRRMREEARDRLGEAQLRQSEIRTRLDHLTERVSTEYGRNLDALDTPGPDFDPAGARAELPDLHQQLRSLGAVNELALESYEEQKERLDFMLAQQDDLEQAENSLRSTIREINTTARERFEGTFEAVREAFQRLFSDLFGQNATADLLLAGNDPLEDDIEIRARPKGKKPSTIAQLSGGEKTLTAIALLFAIYLVKPSPFCILDEVDAPLDDSNIERFMRLIRSFSDSTQFILVTHNKLTMEAADRMYGVTMQEQGVSKLVGVRFSEVLPAAA